MAQRRLRLVIGAIALLVVVGLVAVVANRPSSDDVRVAASASGAPTPDHGSSEGAPTSSSTIATSSTEPTVAAPVETTAPTVTTTTAAPAVPLVATTLTTAPPASTTTVPVGPDATHARLYIENEYAVAVTVGAGDETGNQWTLASGGSAGPWDMATSTQHGDGASVARLDDPGCGSGDGEEYFHGGHVYKLVVKTRSTNCADGPGPELFIYDLTTGTTRTI